MPVSADGILEVVFDPAWAAVRLVVDGGMWPAPVDAITVTRSTPGAPVVPVRGLEARPVVGGYYVGTDHEMDLDSAITYRVAGTSGGEPVAAAEVVVSTSGAQWGLWLKCAGRPDLTCLVEVRDLGAVVSQTIGDVYQIAGGGGSVAQTSAHWSGIEAAEVPVVVAADAGSPLARLRALLRATRVLLVQSGQPTELDPGWYYVRSDSLHNPGGFLAYDERHVTMRLVRTGVPAGQGGTVTGSSWAQVMETYPTWADVVASVDSWFDLVRGV